jgi:hypothetical protein
MKAKKAYEGKNSLWRRLADTVSIYSFGGTPQEADKDNMLNIVGV